MSKRQDNLRSYREKRDFRRTGEPSGTSSDRQSGASRFVIQRHEASTSHYDLRLEVDGVLKSWAVPKGPSTDPREKRLAVPTEDHPLDYADFEGVIPEDEYGAGTVLVWDRGTYRNITGEESEGGDVPAGEAIDQGHLAVWLEGEKLRGGYALTRMQGGDDEQWLLVKMDDEQADARRNPTSTEPNSVLSDRTVDQIAQDAHETDDS